MRTSYAIFIAAAAFAAGYIAAPRSAAHAEPIVITRTDTIVTRDTVRVTITRPVTSRPAERVVTVRDTIILPATRRVYTDTLYRAVVSGVDPRLDSLTIFPTRLSITTQTYSAPRAGLGSSSAWRHWGIGITAGVALTPRGITPAVTLGLTYKL